MRAVLSTRQRLFKGMLMTFDKRLSKTMRIDLTAGDKPPLEEGPGGSVSSLTRMDWQQRRKAPEYVARSRYQELLQSLYDAALVTRLTGEIIDVNARAVEFLHHERADLFVMTIYEIISGADETLMKTLLENLDRERFSLIQAYCLRKDGSYFPAEIAVSRLRLDEVCLCFFIRDISWRVETEDRLRLEHQALQIAGNGIVIADQDGRLVYANPAFARMLGYDHPEALIEGDIRDFFPSREAANHLMMQVKSDEQTWGVETAMRHSSGRDVYVQVSATCNRSESGEAVGVVFSFADITEHKRTQDQMQVAHAALERKVDEQAAAMAELREAAADRDRAGVPAGH
ncbi:MAG: PAS domain S-box protein [Lentisphaerae bacterium]|nr:PAS domain S-box protein [Lentisphaerota bacterium]